MENLAFEILLKKIQKEYDLTNEQVQSLKKYPGIVLKRAFDVTRLFSPHSREAFKKNIAFYSQRNIE